jgi:hypothetical protein
LFHSYIVVGWKSFLFSLFPFGKEKMFFEKVGRLQKCFHLQVCFVNTDGTKLDA